MSSNGHGNNPTWVVILVALIGAAGLIIASLITSSRNNPETQPITTPLSTKNVPGTPEEAADLFGGPSSTEWTPCRDEPNCWMFALPGSNYTVSVPENCVNEDGSIHGWRLNGGYPEKPDSTRGTIRIWNDLEAATIRCK